MTKKNGTGKTGKETVKAELLKFTSEPDRITKHKVRLPSDVMRAFVEQPAPESVIQKIAAAGFSVGEKTVLDALIGICGINSLTDPTYAKIVLNMLEPKFGAAHGVPEFDGEADEDADTYIVERFREVLVRKRR